MNTIRVQRSRKKGATTPPNTKYVGRPTQWGNPFKVGETAPDILDEMYSGVGNIVFSEKLGRMVYQSPSYLDGLTQLKYLTRGHIIEDKEAATKLFREYIEWLKDKHLEQYKELIKPLKGKNLSCWCKLDEFCHLDVLLEHANQ
jgi:hypothetical protein